MSRIWCSLMSFFRKLYQCCFYACVFKGSNFFLNIIFGGFAADGVAMGAAINMSEIHITLIIFFAIMLHKVIIHFQTEM